MLGHPCALNIRHSGISCPYHRLVGIRNFVCILSALLYKFLKQGINLCLALWLFAMVLPKALIPNVIWIAKDQFFFLTHGFHGLRVQFYPPDRGRICTPPVKIEPSIIIPKQIRIPVIHIPRYFFIGTMDWILGAIKTTLHVPIRCRKIQIFTYHTHIRCIVVNWHIFRQRITIPMCHIF